MKSILMPVVLLECFLVAKSQRLTAAEMKEIETFIDQYNRTKPSQMCKLAMDGKWFPEIPYIYTSCAINKEETEQIIVNVDTTLPQCQGFDCWESQLTETSRFDILDIMNKYREKVVLGICQHWCGGERELVMELRWYTNLEIEAKKLLHTCNTSGTFSYKRPNDENYPLDIERKSFANASYDGVIVTFDSRTGLQREMRSKLWTLMAENKMNDWNTKTKTYRRSLFYDVGCALLVRRDVPYEDDSEITRNVIHLACLFGTEIDLSKKYDKKPEQSNCRVILSRADYQAADIDDENNYPSLCKVKLDVSRITVFYPFMQCQAHITFLLHSCVNSSKSEITWREKKYGYGLRMISGSLEEADCNLPDNIPVLPPVTTNLTNYNCTYQQLVYVDGAACPYWSCRDSQLRDAIKTKILNYLNEARHLVANQKCPIECPCDKTKMCEYGDMCEHCGKHAYCNMINLQWHWYLESKAAEKVRNCTTVNEVKQVIYEDHPFQEPVVFHQITSLFELPGERGQIHLPETFRALFWSNAFGDWKNNSDFVRGNAQYIGCAIIVRPKISLSEVDEKYRKEGGITTHMVCVYAALEENFITIVGLPNDDLCCPQCEARILSSKLCSVKTIKNVPPYANLCSSLLLEFTMSCEAEEECIDNDDPSVAWDTLFHGYTIVQDLDGSFFSINRSAGMLPSRGLRRRSRAAFFKKYCWILILFFLLLLSILSLVLSFTFKYRTEKDVFRKKFAK